MTIPPIGAYSFRPIRTTRKPTRTKKADKKSITKSETKLSLEPDSTLFEDGDLDSSTLWFSKKGANHVAGEGFDEDLLLAQLNAVQDLIQTQQFEQKLKRWLPKVYQSYQNMTLPEALIYHALLDTDCQAPLSATLILDQKPVFIDRLEFDLLLKQKNTIIKNWRIQFILPQKKVTIHDSGKQIGWARYIIRGQKIEEIEGRLLGKPLLLDPIWKPTTKLDLREERIHLGNKKWTLIYKQNQKYSLQNNQTQLTISQSKTRKDPVRCLTCKEITFNDRAIRSQLLYIKFLLIPFFAEWKIK